MILKIILVLRGSSLNVHHKQSIKYQVKKTETRRLQTLGWVRLVDAAAATPCLDGSSAHAAALPFGTSPPSCCCYSLSRWEFSPF